MKSSRISEVGSRKKEVRSKKWDREVTPKYFMDWKYLDKEFGKVYQEDTISPDDKKTLQLLGVILKKRYPYLKQEGIRKAMQMTFDSMYEPYWVDNFLPRLAEKMYEVPYKILVGKTKKPKS